MKTLRELPTFLREKADAIESHFDDDIFKPMADDELSFKSAMCIFAELANEFYNH